jgi:hypothetical protein
MAKIKFNPLLAEVSGSIGKLTVRPTAHGMVLSSKPAERDNWSPAQKSNREKLGLYARIFYRQQMSNAACADHYRARALALSIPVSAFVMGGFMKHGEAFAEMERPFAAPDGQADGRDGADAD